MPQGDKGKYTRRQKRKARHIEEGYETRGVSEREAARRAYATVNKEEGGGRKSGSHSGKKTSRASSRKGGRKGGRAHAGRMRKSTNGRRRNNTGGRKRKSSSSRHKSSHRKS